MALASMAMLSAGDCSSLDQAITSAAAYNWADAEVGFQSALKASPSEAKPGDVATAKCGLLRATMERRQLSDVVDQLTAVLDGLPSEAVTARVFCLAARGDVHGEIDAATMKRDWEEVRKLATDAGDHRLASRASGEIGLASFVLGDVVTARQLVAGALVTAERSRDVPALVRFLSAIANSLALGKMPEQAFPYLAKAEKAIAAAPEMGYYFPLPTARLAAFRKTRQFDAAEAIGADILSQARRLKRKIKEAQTLITLADVSAATGRVDQGEERLRLAVNIAQEGGFPRLALAARFDLADLYRKSNRLDEAEAQISQGLDSVSDASEVYLVPRRLLTLAQLQSARRDWQAADATYDRGEAIISGLIDSNPNFAVRTSLVSQFGELHTEHFALLAGQLRDSGRAFSVMEQIRARAMRDLLAAGAKQQDSDPSIDRRVSRLRLALVTARTRAERHSIQDAIFYEDQRRWIAPPDARSRIASTPVALADVQQTLEPEELLLAFVVSARDLYRFTITRAAVRLDRVDEAAEIAEQIEQLRSGIRAKRSTSTRRLSKILLPAEASAPTYRHVVIARDGVLHSLPFDTLQDSRGRLLAETRDVSFIPSASILHLLRSEKRLPVIGGVFALGGVPYSANTAKLASARGMTVEGWGNIPASRDEAVAAAQFYRPQRSRAIVGAEATERVLQEALARDFSIIHIAAHGHADEVSPDRAAVLLQPDPKNGNDGILDVAEIGQWRTTARLVVLSACDTGVGRLQGQEGIANLSRAFLLAGAQAVVSTLWPVDDTFTLALMRSFYRNLGAGRPPSEALALAKRELMRKFGPKLEPYYWAGFILEGEGSRPLTSRRGHEPKQ